MSCFCLRGFFDIPRSIFYSPLLWMLGCVCQIWQKVTHQAICLISSFLPNSTGFLCVHLEFLLWSWHKCEDHWDKWEEIIGMEMQVCSISSCIYTFKLLRGRHAKLTFLLSDRVQEDQKVQEECTNLDQIDCLISHQPWISTQKDHFHCKCLCIEGVCTRVHDHGTSSRPPVAAEDICKIAKTSAKCVVLSAVFASNFEHRRLLFGPQWWVVLLLLVLVKKASNHSSPCTMGKSNFAHLVECHILWCTSRKCGRGP